MKTKVFLVLVVLAVFFSCPALAQLIPDGVQKEYYPSGEVHYERNYKDGKKDGASKEFYENGVLKAEATRVEGKLQGVMKSYYQSGALDQTYEYKDDVIEGTVSKYLENGKLDHETIYVDGKPTGAMMNSFQYYDNGNLKMEYHWNGEKKEALRKEYYEDGKISLMLTIKDGKELKEEYDEQGKLISK